MLKCIVNGKEVNVPEGTTLIEAFRKAGEDIAHYCWHPGLKIAGVCRLCMVEVKGMPRLALACNTKVVEGMDITNKSEKVQEAVKWGMEFHLVNHPLDCPICDQAGECGLQDQYMKFAHYTPQMSEKKVKKHKVVDLGQRVVLDTERCILCSRCVRFTEDVSKTNELQIFQRGDHSEIGTFSDQPLNNKYSLNTVDICPVGALTAKDFRFRQRVWFLKSKPSLCTGCSTGCNIEVYFNKNGYFRVKPRYNSEVNGYWMCDEGRDVYKFANLENRCNEIQYFSKKESQTIPNCTTLQNQLKKDLLECKPEEVAFLITGTYTQEENQSALNVFTTSFNKKHIYHWVNNPNQIQDFDGLLLRGDRNPNTKGLKKTFDSLNVKALSLANLEKNIQSGEVKALIVAGPEIISFFPEIEKVISFLPSLKWALWMTSTRLKMLEEAASLSPSLYIVPMKSYLEKNGSFINFQDKSQEFKKVQDSHFLDLIEAFKVLNGTFKEQAEVEPLENSDQHVKNETLVKNEFVYQRGPL